MHRFYKLAFDATPAQEKATRIATCTLNEGIIHWHASGMNNRFASD
jgi:hypothetical protein